MAQIVIADDPDDLDLDDPQGSEITLASVVHICAGGIPEPPVLSLMLRLQRDAELTNRQLAQVMGVLEDHQGVTFVYDE